MVKRFNSNEEMISGIGIGFVKVIEKWLKDKNKIITIFKAERVSNTENYTVTVYGNAVFEDINTIYLEFPGLKNKLKFINTEGTYITNLSDLLEDDIFQRIKKNYHRIHENCIGKTISQQNFILFGSVIIIKKSGIYTCGSSISEGEIEKGKEYLDSLPSQLLLGQFLDLANQILNGCLKYPINSIHKQYFEDEFGVRMDNYANSLKCRFSSFS